MRKLAKLAPNTVRIVCCCVGLSAQAAKTGGDLMQALSSVAQRFDELTFSTADKHDRRTGFEALITTVEEIVGTHPDSAGALAWQGIVLSTYAGEVSALSAMKYAKAAREALHTAESLDATVMHGSVYTSLGALYAHVPGGFVGFGDDALAMDYLRKALRISPNDLDANFFYAELLLEQKLYDEAERVLHHALTVPPVPDRPVLDRARRDQMRAMLESIAG